VKRIVVGDLVFSKKTDAVEHFKRMLNSYNLGDKVSLQDAKLLEELLKTHPEANEKIGAGVASFSIRSADFGTRCFWINRIDGTTEKFSFRSCLG